MMAKRGKQALALIVACMMVMGMLPGAALATGSEAEHVHGQAGLVGETYYTGVCEYTEGETVKSETPDLCDEALNVHEHTEACTAEGTEGEETAVCAGEPNAHAHTDACYSVTQTEGSWTCETGEPPVEEEPVEVTPPAEESTEETPPTEEVEEEPVEEPAGDAGEEELVALMSAEPMTYTISDANAFKVTEWRGNIPEFSFEGVPGSTIDPKDLPAGPVLYQFKENDWYYIYTGKVMGTGWEVGYTIDYLELGADGTVTAVIDRPVLSDIRITDMSSLRFFYDYAFAFKDLGSTDVTVMYSVDGGALKEMDLSQPLIFSQDDVDDMDSVAFFVKAGQGYYPVDNFEHTSGDQKGILSRLDDPKGGLSSDFDSVKADALAQGFTHEFHYSQFKDGLFSDQGVRGFKLAPQADPNKYTITYHANAPQGTQASGDTAAQSGTWNTRFDIAENGFTIPHYKFLGWNTAADGSGESYAPGYPYTIMGKDLVLYAQWEVIPQTKLDAKFFIREDGTVPMEDGTTGYDANNYLPINSTDPNSADYRKLVWGKIYGKAAWTNYSGVIVDGKINGVKLSEAFASVSAEIADAPTAEEMAAATGLSFDPNTQAVAWYVVKNIEGDGWHVDGVIYDKNAKYVLQYFPNAGEDNSKVTGLPGSKLYAEDAKAPISYGSMTREGYDFLGWSKNPKATEATYTPGGNNQTIDMTGDTYLYAVWEKETPAPEIFTVSFETNNTAVAKPVDQKVPKGDKAVDPQIPNEAGGKTFLGWYIDGTGDKFNFATPVTKDYVLLGRWETTKPATYTVTVNFLVETAKEPLRNAYVSGPMVTGTEYDVEEKIPTTIPKDGVTYTRHHTVDGNDIAGTIKDHDVVINVYYWADRDYTVEYFLETGHGTGVFEMSKSHSDKGALGWNSKPVTSDRYAIAIDGYTYDAGHKGNVKQVAYNDPDLALTLKLYYKKDAPVDPGTYRVIYTDGTGLDGSEHRYEVTKAVGETYAVLADNSTTKFAKSGHSFDSWKLRENSVVHGSGDKLYGDKGATIYYDAQWTAGTYPVTVTKTVSGQSLPANFSVVITDQAGETVETLDLTQATLTNGTYTWTTKALTFGQTYTFTEQNYAVSGYDLAASVQVLTGTDANGSVYQTTNGVAATMTLNDLAQTTGTAVAFTNSYSQTQTGGGGGGGDSYSYYRVTVRYLDRETGEELVSEFKTDRIREGRRYDVTEEANKAIRGYKIDEVEGDTTGTIRGNLTIKVWYVADTGNNTTDIPDNDVPRGDTPIIPPAGQPSDNNNGQGGATGGGNEIDIQDGDVPQGGRPTGDGELSVQPADGNNGNETVIIDEGTPLGNLPQTGTLSQQTDPTRTLGMLALALSLAAAGLAVTIGRKKEDEA